MPWHERRTPPPVQRTSGADRLFLIVAPMSSVRPGRTGPKVLPGPQGKTGGAKFTLRATNVVNFRRGSAPNGSDRALRPAGHERRRGRPNQRLDQSDSMFISSNEHIVEAQHRCGHLTTVYREKMKRFVCLILFLLAATPLRAQNLPPVPFSLLNASGVVCVRVSRDGGVVGAYILRSTGNTVADRDLLSWVNQLHWPKAVPGEKLRTTWFPMPIAFGDRQPPTSPPKTCAPPKAGS